MNEPAMSELRAAHLNDEQFCALLAGEELGAGQAHLDACAECRAEMERVAASMESFATLGMEWAERRSATLPPVRSRARAAWTTPLAWASALLALAVFAGVHRAEKAPAVAQGTAVASPAIAMVEPTAVAETAPAAPARALTRDEQIAEDNRMLLAIRQELTQPETLMLLSPGARSARTARTVND